MANYCRAGIKSLRGTVFIHKVCERGAFKFTEIILEYMQQNIKHLTIYKFMTIDISDTRALSTFYLLTSENVKIESIKKQGSKEWRRDVLL